MNYQVSQQCGHTFMENVNLLSEGWTWHSGSVGTFDWIDHHVLVWTETQGEPSHSRAPLDVPSAFCAAIHGWFLESRGGEKARTTGILKYSFAQRWCDIRVLYNAQGKLLSGLGLKLENMVVEFMSISFATRANVSIERLIMLTCKLKYDRNEGDYVECNC